MWHFCHAPPVGEMSSMVSLFWKWRHVAFPSRVLLSWRTLPACLSISDKLPSRSYQLEGVGQVLLLIVGLTKKKLLSPWLYCYTASKSRPRQQELKEGATTTPRSRKRRDPPLLQCNALKVFRLPQHFCTIALQRNSAFCSISDPLSRVKSILW